MGLNLRKRAKYKWTKQGWIGVDLDGTLAEYTEWKGPEHIGKPIKKMLDRVKKWIEDGQEVRIMTARAAEDVEGYIIPIEDWLEKYGIGGLDITHKKDFEMIELWDDRAVQVKPNTGERVDGED